MTSVRVQEAAALQIDEFSRYSRNRWGKVQADAYVTGMFEAFHRIAAGGVASCPVSAEFGVDGYVVRYEKHFVFWKTLNNWDTGVVAVLLERMHRISRIRKDSGYAERLV